ITTSLAITVGLTIVNIFKPGAMVAEEQRKANRVNYEMWALNQEGVTIKDGKDMMSKLSDEEIEKLKEKGEYKKMDKEMIEEKISTAEKTKEAGPLQFIVDMVPSNIFKSFTQSLMLQVIVFAVFFGVTLLMIPKEKATPVLNFIDGVNEVFIKMVDIVMRAAPFFVFALLAGKISELAGDNPKNVLNIFEGLGWYALTVIFSLFILAFVIYPLIIMLFSKDITYRGFFSGIGAAQTLAFSTSSSAATLPVTMECVRDNLKVSRETTSFVLPIGATVNMDGTSLYQAVAVIFLAQFHMVDLTIAQQLTIVLTATLASIGSAAVPSAGIIMLILVLESVGLNPAWIAIIFPVDRILDMCRTVVNITGDATVTTIIDKLSGNAKTQ
ncbi:MAG: dicarboxylate/amino acid:cation symporter, partial [Flavobacteriales bacterium]